jgi:hypothetical protein
MYNADKRNRTSNALKFLLALDPALFDGGVFEKNDATVSGCLVHHMYHAKALPWKIHEYIECAARSSPFGYSEFAMMLNDHYGEGGADLLHFEASKYRRDYAKFVTLVKAHYCRLGGALLDEVEAEANTSVRTEYELKANDRTVLYNKLEDAKIDRDALHKFGIIATLTEFTETRVKKTLL